MEYLTPKKYMDTLFPKVKESIVEIGFGNGIFLKWLSEHNPNKLILGVDLANLAFKKAKMRLKDYPVFLIKSEGNFFVKYMVSPSSISEIYILYPDPWPKDKKRRLLNPNFLLWLKNKLAKDGKVFIATDHEEYAHEIFSLFSSQMVFEPWNVPIETKYMRKWTSMGKSTFSFCFINKDPIHLEFKPALTKLECNRGFLEIIEGKLIRLNNCVLKLDSVFTSNEDPSRSILRLIWREDNFNHIYFALSENGSLYFLNTWGEVFSPALEEALKLI